MTFNSFQIVFHTKDIGKSKMKEKDAKSQFIYYTSALLNFLCKFHKLP